MLLRVQAWGHVFPVAAVRDSAVATGEPVVVFGFPGIEQSGNWQREGLRASVMLGTLVGVSGNRLEIEGYGGASWTGSPVFNGEGEMIGVMAAADAGSRRLRAITASTLRGWMGQ
jgi:hypothetical protein